MSEHLAGPGEQLRSLTAGGACVLDDDAMAIAGAPQR